MRRSVLVQYIPVFLPSGQPAAVHKIVGTDFEHHAKHGGLQGEAHGSAE